MNEFIQEPTSRSERELTEVVDIVARRLVNGVGTFDSLPKFTQHGIKSQLLPIVTATLNWADEQPHRAKRGDEIEAWIKERRDGCHWHSDAWHVLDHFLDDYRLHADTGTRLGEDIEEH